MKILLIDDDKQMAEPLTEYFARFNLELFCAVLPGQGLQWMSEQHFDLVILDIMLPEMDGFTLCRNIRKTSDIPILMLTARGEVTDRIVGLELGADDYLPKPFDPRELVARIQTIIKRSQTSVASEPHIIKYESITIDTAKRQVQVKGKVVTLTHMEFELLALLAKSPGVNFTRDQILNHLRGIDAEIFTRAVDNMISRLRNKLKPVEPIKTVWGSGYTFIAAD